MGHIKKQRRKYKTPSHPWNRERIASERIIVDEYGLMNKKEILRLESVLRNIKHQAKDLITRSDKQAELEWERLKARLLRMGLITGEFKLERILDLSIKDVLERRLQTQVVRKGLARSMTQARQFITHRHILVGAHKVSVPGHLVTIEEEHMIAFSPNSPFIDEAHPERMRKEVVPEVKEEEKPKKDSKKKKAKAPEAEIPAEVVAEEI